MPNYQLPITNSQLPITNSQLPITNSQLPITNSQLPMPKPPAQALIEFAITLPILILIAIGIISIGYMLTAQQIITHAAKEGARIGAQTNDNAQINGTIEAIIKSFDSDLTRTKINIDPQDQNSPDRQRGNTLSVEITYEIPFQIPIFSENTLKVNAKSLARIEYE